MKSKLSNTFSLLRLSIIAVLAVLCSSCDKTETTDSTGFILHYLGITDIGPSMSYTLKAPTYKGSAPYDFSITNVTFNDETYNNEDNFVINAETGEITIQNTETMSAGLYNISVGCYSNGSFYNFKNAVQVNMLLAVPEGVTVEPAEVLVNQDEENWIEASAQVITEKDKHVSIVGYAIAQDESKPYLAYFNISSNGKITINPDTKDKLIAGEHYTLSLRLTTLAGNHMYADAVTFKVVAKPRNLFYIEQEFMPDLFEIEQQGESVIPTIEGSKENLKFTIKSVKPESSAFNIDTTTGQISIPEGNNLTATETPYVFDITVENAYGSTDFKAVYSVKIVTFIEPIVPEKFHYTPINSFYLPGSELTNYAKDNTFIGGAATFEFDSSNSDEIKALIEKEIITINSGDGSISITKDHTLSIGEHNIQVKVSNRKNKEGVVKPLTITVYKNPNSMDDTHFVSWGTNVETPYEIGVKQNFTPKKESTSLYRNIIRFPNRGNITSELPILDYNLPEATNIKYDTVERFPNKFDPKYTKIDPSTGTITTGGANGFGAYDGGILVIAVTVSGNNAPAVTKNIPIFFTTPKNYNKDNRGMMLIDPCVVRVNPRANAIIRKSINCKVVEYGNGTVKSEKDISNLILDFRNGFSYLNLDNNSNHQSGTLSNESQPTELLYQVWDNCKTGIDKGNSSPMSWYGPVDGKQDPIPGKEDKAAYIDATTREIVINPNKWIGADKKYANGAVIAQIRYNLDGQKTELDDVKDTGGKSGSVHPVIIWFDENFE